MNNVCISVIVPIYNVEEYLRECIESILKQSYKNLQIILVDDGSTDLSGEICDEYSRLDDRIEVIHKKNGGLVDARKSGLSIAVGDYIGFVDGDDYIDENMYSSLIEYMTKMNADVVHTGYWVNDGTRRYKRVDFDKKLINTQEDKAKLLNEVLSMKTDIEPSIWSKLFKKKIIDKTYKDVKNESSYGEDLICLIATIIWSDSIYIVDDAYYHYRIRNVSLSHGMGVNGISKEVILYENIKDVLVKYNFYDKYKDKLNYRLGKAIIYQMKKFSSEPFIYETYYFNEPEIVQKKNIIIYGAGAVGRDYYSQFSRYMNCNVVAWVDSNAENIKYTYIDIKSPEIIKEIQFDYIVIATLNKSIAANIEESLKILGVSNEKIMWRKPEKY